MRQLPELDPIGYLSDCYIAGGAVLSTVTKADINDYDIYPKSYNAVWDIAATLIDDSDGYVVNLTDRAITIKRNDVECADGRRGIFQIIIGEFKSPEEIFDCFDFTVTMGAYDCDTKEYTFHERFWQDVAARTLNFHMGTLYPINSLFRVSKYRERGYWMGKSEMAKIAIRIAQDGLPETWEDFEKQIGGVYGRSVKLAREDKEFTIENLLEILDSGMQLEYSEDGEFSSYDIEDIILYYEVEPENYGKLCLKNTSGLFRKNSDGYWVLAKSINSFMTGNELLTKVDEIDPEDKILGYKFLKEEDGELYPSIRGTNSEVTYTVGEETRQEEKSKQGYGGEHYLYLFNKQERTTKGNPYLAYTKAGDIVSVSKKELNTKAITIIKELEKDGTDLL